MKSLREGPSFVTTGPLMQVFVNNEPPRRVYHQTADSTRYEIKVEIWPQWKATRWEVLQEGRFVAGGGSDGGGMTERRPPGKPFATAPRNEGMAAVMVRSSTWFVVRCFEKLPDGRERFAHSAPIFIDVEGKPLRPRKAEVEYLVSRVRSEIERNTGVLSEEALAEYREALAAYESIAKTAQ